MKLLCVVGPTATGKTNLALKLAKRFSGHLISADSRQVYEGMDVGTGKDIPPHFHQQGECYTNGAINIYGYDVVSPKQEFSVAHFVENARRCMRIIWKNDHLPIVVGGTGLYIKSLLAPPATLLVPQNPRLRAKLETASLTTLQTKLRQADKAKWNSMNHSDQYNPRRLIRALEVAGSKAKKLTPLKADVQMIGLTAPLKKIDAGIVSRVRKRLDTGMEAECLQLQSLQLPPSAQAINTLGYAQILAYMRGELSKAEAIRQWITAEKQYARRQLTWFKKQPGINWYSVEKKGWENDVVSLVEAWYSGPNDQS